MNLCNDLYQENLKSQEFPYFLLRVIHKPCGQNFGLFYPPPPLWTILLNMVYVVCNMDIWQTPSPCHVHMVYECPPSVNSGSLEDEKPCR